MNSQYYRWPVPSGQRSLVVFRAYSIRASFVSCIVQANERRFRLNQKEEQNRKAEIEMAHTALMPSKDGDRFIAAPVDEASHALTADTDELDLSGYELVSITNFDNDEQSLGTLLSAEEVSEEAKEVVKAALFRYGAENKACSRLIVFHVVAASSLQTQ